MRSAVFLTTFFLAFLLQSCSKNDSPTSSPDPVTPVETDTLTAGWQLKKIDSLNRGIADMTFINANTGFACGDNIMLRKTVDGGSTWRQVSVTTGSGTTLLNNIQFVNNQYGFIAANAGVLRTTDGGNTWNLVSSPGSLTTDVFFLNPGTGFYTSGSGLQKSVDSGKTWTRISTLFTSCSSLWFTDATKGFVTTSNGLYKTTDAGATFSQVFSNNKGSYISIYFVNATNGCAGFGTDLYVTNDGGSTWSVLKQFPSAIIDAKNINDSEYYVSTQSEIWHTTDKGNTWVREVKLANNKSAIEFTLGQPGHIWISASSGFVLYK